MAIFVKHSFSFTRSKNNTTIQLQWSINYQLYCDHAIYWAGERSIFLNLTLRGLLEMVSVQSTETDSEVSQWRAETRLNPV